MLEFLQNLPSTTISTTTISTTTSASTLTFELITKISPDWSIPLVDLMKNLYSDDRFDDIRKCLLKYVYGDNWSKTAQNCSKHTIDMDLVTTTVIPEHTISPIPSIFLDDIVVSTTPFTIPASTSLAIRMVPMSRRNMITTEPVTLHNDTSTTKFTIPASLPPVEISSMRALTVVNATSYNGGSTIVLLLISIIIRFN